MCEFSRPIRTPGPASIQKLLFSSQLFEVEGAAWQRLGHLRAGMCKLLEGRIVRSSLLGSKPIKLWRLACCEAVSLEGCVCRGLFLELCERIRACRTFGATEERHRAMKYKRDDDERFTIPRTES